jgi:hypothetical protein
MKWYESFFIIAINFQKQWLLPSFFYKVGRINSQVNKRFIGLAPNNSLENPDIRHSNSLIRLAWPARQTPHSRYDNVTLRIHNK